MRALSIILVCAVQGINAIIFYAPVLFEQIGGQGLGNLLNTVVIDAGETVPLFFHGLCFAFTSLPIDVHGS